MDRPGRGKQPDEARYLFFRQVTALYKRSAANPKAPWKDPVTDEVHGELFHLYKACLAPLGTQETPLSILSTFERAVGRLDKINTA